MSEKISIKIEDKIMKLEVIDLKNWEINNGNQENIFPYFKAENEQSVKEGVPTYRRYSVIAVIKHNKEDKYLCVDSKTHICKSFVLGGIEKGETPEQAAIREVKEETGYTDLEIEYKFPTAIINHFYAGYKGDFNRFSTLYIVFGKLKSEKNIGISENEDKKHTVKWIYKDQLEEFISLEHNKLAMKILLDKNVTYTGKGIKILGQESI